MENKIFKRNELGLVDGIEYKYKPDGTIDWRAMINPSYLVINKQYENLLVKRFLKPINEISISEVEDSKLLILLQGIKEIASLRGYTSVKPKVDYVSDNKVVVSTQIEWLPNFETNNQPVSFGDIGSASLDNTSGFGQMYLEAIATNRAFVRAVRNFLTINVVANDEIDVKATEEFLSKKKESGQHMPIDVLEKLMLSKNITFEQLKSTVLSAHVSSMTSNPSEWSDLRGIPVKDVLKLINLLKN